MQLRPLIALTSARKHVASGMGAVAATAVATAYSDAINQAGGRAVIMPAHTTASEDALDGFDGLLLTGGADIDPGLYGQMAVSDVYGVDPARDATEIHFLGLAENAGLPVLAICRGLQLVNAVRGGTLVQHLKPPQDHWQEASPHSAHHSVTIPAGSRLHRILGCKAEVNSYHHQAVDRLGDGLAATAFCGPVIEAFESRDGSIVGVQWHPEFLATRHPGQMGIFRDLVAAARRRRQTHSTS